MGSQRSLLKTVSSGIAGKRHYCRGNKKHVFTKGDLMLVVKVERDEAHYCVDCAQRFIATARVSLSKLEEELLHMS